MLIRLQKFLAQQGIASHRSIEKMIADRKIFVNGQLVTKQGTKVDPDKDVIKVNDQTIHRSDEFVYYWLNKPVGILSAASSKYGEQTVADLVHSSRRVYPVGRLDKDSQGLILLTNDGALTHRLTHPKFHLDKTYVVEVVGHISQEKLDKLRNGIELEEGTTLPATVNEIGENVLEFIIHEGKHRQIRRMCATVRLHVESLTRVQFGPIKLGKLQLGESRLATHQEIQTLKQLVGLSDGGQQKVVDKG